MEKLNKYHSGIKKFALEQKISNEGLDK